MSDLTLAVQTRTVMGKKVKRLRKDGIVPIVVYGRDLKEALPLQVNKKDLQRVLRNAGTSNVIKLKIDDRKSHLVLARTVDRHPTRHNIMHADFLAVRLDRPVEATIPIKLVGQSPMAARNAAVLRQVLAEVTLEALPNALPAVLDVDVSALDKIGQTISLSDIELTSSIKIITDGKAQIARLDAPKRIIEETEETAEAEAEA